MGRKWTENGQGHPTFEHHSSLYPGDLVCILHTEVRNVSTALIGAIGMLNLMKQCFSCIHDTTIVHVSAKKPRCTEIA